MEGAIEIQGKWKGTYYYNIPKEISDIEVGHVDFVITILSVKRSEFEGTVEDNIEMGGTPGIGKIKGRCTDTHIYFEKFMPVYGFIKRNGEHHIDHNKKHPVLIYEGLFSQNKRNITGSWKFKKRLVFWKGIIPMFISTGNGSFVMTQLN
ncbi:hypothetical protein [Sporocytophaga myxococcoides]|uniref:hypothetical protein n=1 Tax=Sporocytophaga myxococcoides TaxID=153721 RepID=UPI000420F419|nr:hypothetical protein [Sporocytophaga myxococcoides]